MFINYINYKLQFIQNCSLSQLVNTCNYVNMYMCIMYYVLLLCTKCLMSLLSQRNKELN